MEIVPGWGIIGDVGYGEVHGGMGLLKKTRGKAPRRRGQKVSITCAFCRELVPEPRVKHDVFSGSGRLGGRCECSAVYVIDETGKDGGLALLDAQALACDGDLDRAMTLDSGVDFKLKIREVVGRTRTGPGRARVSGYLAPKVWFLKLTV